MNICVFGDSVSKGVIFDEIKNKYIFSKSSFFNLAGEATQISVKNFSKFGCTVAKGSEILEKQSDALSQYEYTIVEYGGNDCDLDWPGIAETPNDEHPAQVPIEKFKLIYESLIEKIRAAGSKPVLLTLPPLDAERFFNWVSKGLNKENILKFLGNDVQYIYNWHEGYNNAVLEIAAKENVPIMDIRKLFLSQKNYKDLLCLDGMHPNEKGHKLIAEYLEGVAARLSAKEIDY